MTSMGIYCANRMQYAESFPLVILEWVTTHDNLLPLSDLSVTNVPKYEKQASLSSLLIETPLTRFERILNSKTHNSCPSPDLIKN